MPTGDLNQDGIVDSIDLSLLVSRWNSSDADADLNADGIVDSLDLSILVSNWNLSSDPTAAPLAPTALSITASSIESLTLSWPVTENAQTYNLECNGVVIASDLTTTSYVHSDLAFDTQYVYRVNAANATYGASPWSVVRIGTTLLPTDPLPPPQNILADAGNQSVFLSWEKIEEASAYNVFRSTNPDGPFGISESGMTVCYYTDIGLTNNTQYFYTVTAVNSNGESLQSIPVTAIPVSGTSTPAAELVGTHERAASQTSERGKKINTLTQWKGHVLAGYGDYGANTGPIDIVPFSLAADRFTPKVHTAGTESIEIWRKIRGELYAPSIDRRTADYTVGYTDTWQDFRPISSAHVFDMFTYDGDDLWMIGSLGANAVAWRSIDEGATWSTALSVPPVDTSSFARFYFYGLLNGSIYLQATDYSTGHPTSKRFDGAAWHDAPQLITTGLGDHGETFQSKIVYKHGNNLYTTSPIFYAFDGSSRTTPAPSRIRDYVIHGDTLYALSSTGTIYRTLDLSSWTTIGTAPTTSLSLCVAGNSIFIGTSDSLIYRCRLT